MSTRPAEAARMGYVGHRARTRLAGRPSRPAPDLDDPKHPWVVADRLLCSLLDEQQLADKRRYGRWWHKADRGWLQMGRTPHDIRFRPDDQPGRELSLCVVPADKTLPPGDVWSTLLLTASAAPDTFFRVANVHAVPGPTPTPRNPPEPLGLR